jgi:type I restriction enzyme S subunit
MTNEKNTTTIPKGYKQTKIGVLPVEWEVSTIGKAFTIDNSPRKPISAEVRKDMQGIYPYYGPTKIQDYIDEYQYEGRKALIAEDGDHFLKYADKEMTQIAEGKFNVNNHAHVIDKSVVATVDWFYYFFQHRSIFSHLTRQGAGRFKLNKSALQSLPVALPPLPQQQKIAKILATWDQAIQTQSQLINAKKEQKRGLMQRLLTGEVRLPGFEGERRYTSLADVVLKTKGKIVSTNTERTGKPYVGASNFSGNYTFYSHNPEKAVECLSTDVLMLWDGENAGAVSTNHIGFVSSTVARLRPKEGNSGQYLFHYLDFYNGKIRATRTGSGIPHVARDLLKIFTFDLPNQKEQIAIAEVLQAADKELTLLETYLTELREQKRGLMQRLLTGAVRVTVPATA